MPSITLNTTDVATAQHIAEMCALSNPIDLDGNGDPRWSKAENIRKIAIKAIMAETHKGEVLDAKNNITYTGTDAIT